MTEADAPAPDDAPASPAAPGDAAHDAGAAWLDALPQELRADLAALRSPEELALGYLALQPLLGRKGVKPPGADAGPEEWRAFWRAAGAPDAPEDYAIARPPDIPKDVWLAARAKSWAAAAHEASLTVEQERALRERMLAGWRQSLTDDDARDAAAAEALDSALLVRWGGDAATRAAQAQDVLGALGVGAAALRGLDAADRLGLVRLADAARQLDAEAPGWLARAGARTRPSAAMAEAELKRIRASGSPYWQKDHLQYRALVERALALEEQLVEIRAGG